MKKNSRATLVERIRALEAELETVRTEFGRWKLMAPYSWAFEAWEDASKERDIFKAREREED